MPKVRKSIMLDAENYKAAKAKGWNISQMLDRCLSMLLLGQISLQAQSEKITSKEHYTAEQLGALLVKVDAHDKALRLLIKNTKMLRRLAGLTDDLAMVS
jgi:hypothetical protein